MTRKTFIYSLKIWITSVFVGPLLFAAILCLRQSPDITPVFQEGPQLFVLYILFSGAQMIVSSLTWFIFWLLILLIAKMSLSEHWRTWAIFFTGIGLTVGTFVLLISAFDSFDDPSGLINLMYANCAVIGWGVFYYKLEANYKELRSFN